jgi:chromosome segregation ATPase
VHVGHAYSLTNKKERETMDQQKIDELTQQLIELEQELKETKESLHLINKSIDKYDKYAFLNVS